MGNIANITLFLYNLLHFIPGDFVTHQDYCMKQIRICLSQYNFNVNKGSFYLYNLATTGCLIFATVSSPALSLTHTNPPEKKDRNTSSERQSCLQ